MTVELVWRRPVERATRVPALNEAKSRREMLDHVLGKARTDPLERRDRRRTQADDAERE